MMSTRATLRSHGRSLWEIQLGPVCQVNLFPGTIPDPFPLRRGKELTHARTVADVDKPAPWRTTHHRGAAENSSPVHCLDGTGVVQFYVIVA